MPLFRPIKYTKRETKLFDQPLSPFNKSIRMLAEQSVRYCRIHAQANNELNKDAARYHHMLDVLNHPDTRPPQLIVTDEQADPYGGPLAPKVDLIVTTMNAYDEYLAKKPSTYEDYFWRAQYAVSAMTLHAQYYVPPAYAIPGGRSAYNKLSSAMHREMMRTCFPDEWKAAEQENAESLPSTPVGGSFPLPSHSLVTPSDSGNFTVATPITATIPLHEATRLASDYASLAKKRFRTLDADDNADAQTEEDLPSNEIWTMRTVHFEEPITYDVVFQHMGEPLPYEMDEFIQLLTKSYIVG